MAKAHQVPLREAAPFCIFAFVLGLLSGFSFGLAMFTDGPRLLQEALLGGLVFGTAMGVCTAAMAALGLWRGAIVLNVQAFSSPRGVRLLVAECCGLVGANLVFLYPPWVERTIIMHFAGPRRWRGFHKLSFPPDPLEKFGRVQVCLELMMIEYIAAAVLLSGVIYLLLTCAAKLARGTDSGRS